MAVKQSFTNSQARGRSQDFYELHVANDQHGGGGGGGGKERERGVSHPDPDSYSELDHQGLGTKLGQ